MRLWLHQLAHRLGVNRVYTERQPTLIGGDIILRVCRYCGEVEVDIDDV